MKNIKPFGQLDEIFHSIPYFVANADVSLKILKSVLWEKGWNEYWEASDALKKKLDAYRSVSQLPKDVTEKSLKELSDQLSDLAERIKKIL